jgi:hypothetical protein
MPLFAQTSSITTKSDATLKIAIVAPQKGDYSQTEWAVIKQVVESDVHVDRPSLGACDLKTTVLGEDENYPKGNKYLKVLEVALNTDCLPAAMAYVERIASRSYYLKIVPGANPVSAVTGSN